MAELQPKASGTIYISNITQLNSSNIVYLISVIYVELPTLCEIGISESTTSISPISTLFLSPTSFEVTSSLITGSPPSIYTSSTPNASVTKTSAQVTSGI